MEARELVQISGYPWSSAPKTLFGVVSVRIIIFYLVFASRAGCWYFLTSLSCQVYVSCGEYFLILGDYGAGSECFVN